MGHHSEKQWKFARLVSQLDSLGWVEGRVDLEGLLVHGDCRVFIQIVKFLFQRFWDVVGEHIVNTGGAQRKVKGGYVLESTGHERGGIDPNGLKVLEVAFGSIQKENIVFRRISKVAREVLGVKVCLHEEQFVKKGFAVKKVDMLLDMVESLKVMSTHSHSSSAAGALREAKKKRGHPKAVKEGRQTVGREGCSTDPSDGGKGDRVSLIHPRGDVPCSISVDTDPVNQLTQSNPTYTWDHQQFFGGVDEDAEFLVNYSMYITTDDHAIDGLDHGTCDAKSNLWLLDPDMPTSTKCHHEGAFLQHSTNPLFLTTTPDANHVPSCEVLVHNNAWSSDYSCLLDVVQKRVNEVKECIQRLCP